MCRLYELQYVTKNISDDIINLADLTGFEKLQVVYILHI